MKKKWNMMWLIAVMAGVLTACGGSDEVKVIEKTDSAAQSTVTADLQESQTLDNTTAKTEENGNAVKEADSSSDEYVFEAAGASGAIKLTTDMDMSAVLESLGEPLSYFEAASCAFQGLDKVYTYEHFEVDTYPDGDTDYISSIVLLDDMITTPEGVYIGMTREDMEAVYGTDYETVAGTCVYTKGNTHLAFVIENEAIVSIAYNSPALDLEN